MYAIKVH